jgi:hypothetical protein
MVLLLIHLDVWKGLFAKLEEIFCEIHLDNSSVI